jgi:hypothetical protein
MSLQFSLIAFLIWQIPGAAMLITGLILGGLPPTGRSLDRWASRYGLALVPTNQALVRRYRRRTRSFRWIGAGVAWLSTGSIVVLSGLYIPVFGSWLLVTIAGYMVGDVIAELTFMRPAGTPGAIRAASLERRNLPNYVPPFSIWTLRLLPLVMIALSALYLAAPKLPANPGDPSLATVVGVTAFLILFAFASEQVLRVIVARPQPALSAELVAADDAIRASSIHALTAAGICVSLVGIAATFFWFGYALSNESLHQPLSMVGTLVIVFAVVCWWFLGQPRKWRVQHDGQPVGG